MPWTDSPTVDRAITFLGITSTPDADALGSYADAVDVACYRLAWVDTVSVTLASAGPTPLTVTPSADSLGTYSDEVPTIDKRGNHIYNLSADAWGNLADAAPTVDRRGNHLYSLSDDALGTGADSVADLLTISHVPTADAWGNLADAAPTLDRRGNHLYNLSADAWETLADAAPTVSLSTGSTPITVSLSADDWGTLADSVATRLALTHSPTADAWGTLADSVATGQTGLHRFSLPADANVSYADTRVVASDKSVALASSLQSWADALTGGAGTPSIVVALSDAKPAHSDSTTIILGELIRVPDTWREGPIIVQVTEANEVYADSLVKATNAQNIQVSLTSALNLWADSIVKYTASPTEITVYLSDANVAYTDLAGRASPIQVMPGEYTRFDWTWGAETVLGFNVYYGTSPGTPLGFLQIADPNARTVAIEAVIGPGAWYVSVAAYNATGVGTKSNEVFHQYTRFADAMNYIASSVNISLTDAKLAFSDSVVPKIGIRIIPAADANDAYTDAVAVNPFSNIPVGLTDANEAYTDAVIVLLTKPYALTDANAAYTSTLIHAMGYYFATHKEIAPPADANADYADSVSTRATDLTDVVTPDDANEAYTDAVAVTLSQSSDLQFNMTEAMNAYVDNLLRGLTLSVDVPDDAIPEPVDALGSASGTGRMHPIISSRGVHSLIYGGMLING
jgi:hypothetical protein